MTGAMQTDDPWLYVVLSIMVLGILKGLFDFLMWFLFRRTIDEKHAQLVDLRNEVNDLKQHKVTQIEKALVDHGEQDNKRHAAHNEGRRRLHEQVGRLDRSKMSVEECGKRHKNIMDREAEFQHAVLKLERVAERTDHTAKVLDKVNEQQIALGRDLARLEGRG